MATRLILVRHGETEWTREDRFSGSSDVPLNQTGMAQAQALAERIAGMPLQWEGDTSDNANTLKEGGNGPLRISAIYSSPLRRTRTTAGIIADALRLSVNVVPEIAELHYGAWEGLRRDEVQQRYSREMEQWIKDPVQNAPPDGESGESLAKRVVPAIRHIVTAHPNQTVLVVAHKTVNRLLICSLLNIPLKHYRWAIWQNVACLNILHFVSDDAVSLVKLNDTAHYEHISRNRDSTKG